MVVQLLKQRVAAKNETGRQVRVPNLDGKSDVKTVLVYDTEAVEGLNVQANIVRACVRAHARLRPKNTGGRLVAGQWRDSSACATALRDANVCVRALAARHAFYWPCAHPARPHAPSLATLRLRLSAES